MVIFAANSSGPETSGPHILGDCLYALLSIISIQCKLIQANTCSPKVLFRVFFCSPGWLVWQKVVGWLVVVAASWSNVDVGAGAAVVAGPGLLRSVAREGTGLTAAAKSRFRGRCCRWGASSATTLSLVTQRRPTWPEHTCTHPPTHLPTCSSG